MLQNLFRRCSLAGTLLYALLASHSLARAARSADTHRFAFGSGPAEAGATGVVAGDVYSAERGYGFDFDSKVTQQDGYCTGQKPFFFSVRLPEGNYSVTVTLGDTAGESITTIKTELRRLSVEHVRTAAGKVESRSFSVNVRTPTISGGESVRLKEREKATEAVDWDEKLTFEFGDARPCLRTLQITPLADAVTVYILGDSTVCDQPREPYASWGQMLPRFFNPHVVIANHAESGESLRSSLHAKRLDKVLSTMKKGDYLLIQYGHNDMKEKGNGVGAFTTYKSDLEHFVDATREQGGVPVLITSMHRKSLNAQGKVVNTLGDYPDAVRQLGREKNVPLIDLNAMSQTLYEAIGPADIDKAFADGTHHNNYGSYELAHCIIEGVRQNKLGIAASIVGDLPVFDPTHPDPLSGFDVPASPHSTTVSPLGS